MVHNFELSGVPLWYFFLVAGIFIVILKHVCHVTDGMLKYLTHFFVKFCRKAYWPIMSISLQDHPKESLIW